MKITDVKVRHASNGALRGFATITFDDCFTVGSIAVIDTGSARFIRMPESESKKSGNMIPIARPLTNECRLMIQDAIFEKLDSESAE